MKDTYLYVAGFQAFEEAQCAKQQTSPEGLVSCKIKNDRSDINIAKQLLGFPLGWHPSASLRDI
jgi:hypothetical protein